MNNTNRIVHERYGFSLTATLVIIAIAGLLFGTVYMNMESNRQSRNARRIVDIEQIQKELNNAYFISGSYPASESLYNLMSELPGDPQGGGYAYIRVKSNAYVLGVCLEGERPEGMESYARDDAYEFDVSPQGGASKLQCTCADMNAYCVSAGIR